MITLFERYKKDEHKGNELKFFLRKTNKNSKEGNLCLLLNVQPNSTKTLYLLTVINIPFNLNTHFKHLNELHTN